MLESRLIEHLRALDTTEAADFLRYAKAMTAYEKDVSDDTNILLKYLLKNIDNDEKLIKETVYKNIFPKEAWKNGRLEKLMSYALRFFKNYIVFKKYNNHHYETNEGLALSAFYKKNGLLKQFELNAKQFGKILQNIKQPNSDDFLNHFLIEKEVFNFKTEYNTHTENLNLPETIFALDVFYIIQRLELTLITLIQNTSLPYINDNTKSLIANVLTLATHQAYINNDFIQLYVQAIQLQIVDNEATADEIHNNFVANIEKNKDNLHHSILFTFGSVARIYCTNNYNKGRSEFLTKLLQLFKKQLQMDILYQDKKIRASTLQNIITTAIKLKEYDFVKSFLIEHENKITGTLQPDIVLAYNYALYYFEISNYKKSQELLPNYLDLEDAFYTLAARRLEIKILFETEKKFKYDILGNKIDAFKNYLFENKKNQKISELLFNTNNNFVDLLKQIRSTLKKDHERIGKLIEKLIANAAYAEREWLLEKLEALK